MADRDSNSDNIFDNLIIMKECTNIVNLVRNADFIDIVPKGKLKRVKWDSILNCIKQEIFDDILQELSSLWQDQDMPTKLDILEKQKEKFGELNASQVMWRPKLADVKSQLKAHDIVNLQKQKKLLESLTNKYEIRINKLKKNLAAERAYIKNMQLDIQMYRKDEDLLSNLNARLENHRNIIKDILLYSADVELSWTEGEIEKI